MKIYILILISILVILNSCTENNSKKILSTRWISHKAEIPALRKDLDIQSANIPEYYSSIHDSKMVLYTGFYEDSISLEIIDVTEKQFIFKQSKYLAKDSVDYDMRIINNKPSIYLIFPIVTKISEIYYDARIFVLNSPNDSDDIGLKESINIKLPSYGMGEYVLGDTVALDSIMFNWDKFQEGGLYSPMKDNNVSFNLSGNKITSVTIHNISRFDISKYSETISEALNAPPVINNGGRTWSKETLKVKLLLAKDSIHMFIKFYDIARPIFYDFEFENIAYYKQRKRNINEIIDLEISLQYNHTPENTIFITRKILEIDDKYFDAYYKRALAKITLTHIA
jgi:hypothetical protein